MQTVYLNGELGDKFGTDYKVSCPTIADIFKLLACQLDGFSEYLREMADKGAGFEIRRGSDFISEEELLLSLEAEDVIITPVPAGSKSGAAKILAAVAIVAISFIPGGAFALTATAGATGATSLTLLGTLALSLALSGVSQLLAPGPEVDLQSGGASSEDTGYLFNGPVNSITEGAPVPILYGELLVGGAPINVVFSPHSFATRPRDINNPTNDQGFINIEEVDSFATGMQVSGQNVLNMSRTSRGNV